MSRSLRTEYQYVFSCIRWGGGVLGQRWFEAGLSIRSGHVCVGRLCLSTKGTEAGQTKRGDIPVAGRGAGTDTDRDNTARCSEWRTGIES